MLNVHEYISMDIMKGYGINTPQVRLSFVACCWVDGVVERAAEGSWRVGRLRD